MTLFHVETDHPSHFDTLVADSPMRLSFMVQCAEAQFHIKASGCHQQT